MTKFKKRKEEQLQQQNTEFAGLSNINVQNIRNNNSMAERFGKIFKKSKKKKIIKCSALPKIDPKSCDENSAPTSPVSSNSDLDENRMSDDAIEIDNRLDSNFVDAFSSRSTITRSEFRRIQRKPKNPLKNRNQMLNRSVYLFDSKNWIRIKTCCGFMYESEVFGALLIDADQYIVDGCPYHGKPSTSAHIKNEEIMKMPSVNKSLPPKKQFRQCMIDASLESNIVQSTPIDYSTASFSCNDATNQIPLKPKSHLINAVNEPKTSNYLHKIKSDSGKVTKKAIARLTPKKKVTDLNMIKNLVKLCTDKNASTKNLPTNACDEHNENKDATATATNKYSDNSSDSGYDETLHDTAQLNQIAKIGSTRPVILSNGVKLHVQPENLLLAANLAGVSQTAIQTTQVIFDFHLNLSNSLTKVSSNPFSLIHRPI